MRLLLLELYFVLELKSNLLFIYTLFQTDSKDTSTVVDTKHWWKEKEKHILNIIELYIGLCCEMCWSTKFFNLLNFFELIWELWSLRAWSATKKVLLNFVNLLLLYQKVIQQKFVFCCSYYQTGQINYVSVLSWPVKLWFATNWTAFTGSLKRLFQMSQLRSNWWPGGYTDS